jgi:folate-binding protein YgfZ
MKILTITVTGPDAFEFLQGQLTNDLKRLETDTEIFAAWCNPKGRVIWFGTIRKTDSGFGLSVLAETAETIVQRLTVFRFRSRVDFTIVDDGVTVEAVDLIRGGYPSIGVEQSEQFTPHMLNLDLLDAISFDKGCYTGQEIVARTHYKGATKRRTLRFESEAPVSAGDKVSLDGRDIGEVLNASENDLLAVVPVSKADEKLSVKQSKLSRVSLPYLDVDAS